MSRLLRDQWLTPVVGRLFVGGDSRSIPRFHINESQVTTAWAVRTWAELVRTSMNIPDEITEAPYAPALATASGEGASMASSAMATNEGVLAYVSLLANTALAANASNYRTFQVMAFTTIWTTNDTRAAGLNGLAQNAETPLYDIRDTTRIGSRTFKHGDMTRQYLLPSFFPELSDVVTGSVVNPGGRLRMWVMDRYWNLALGGGQVHEGHAANQAMTGCWSDWFQLQPLARMPALQTRLTAAASSGATTLSVTALPIALGIGARITFQSGITATLTASASAAATSVTVSAISGALIINEIGAIRGGAYGYPFPLMPHIGLATHHGGVLDALNNTFASRGPQHKEAVRGIIAMSCCPYRQFANPSGAALAAEVTIVTSDGSGGTSAWGTTTPTNPWTSTPTYRRLTGTIGGTKPYIEFHIPDWHKAGQAIDLFFAAKTGSGQGYQGTLTYGPGGGALAALDFGGTVRVNGGSSDQVNTGVSTDLAPGGQGVCIVKRISGLPGGGGTIRLTLDTRGNGGSPEFIADLFGIECEPGLGVPFIWLLLPHQPANTGNTTDAALDNWNGNVTAVVAERTEVPGNVFALDLTPVFSTADYFFEDGLHYSDLGAITAADAVIELALSQFTRRQLMAR